MFHGSWFYPESFTINKDLLVFENSQTNTKLTETPFFTPSQRILQRYTDAGLSNDAFPVNTHRSIHVSKAPATPEDKRYRCRALRVTWSGELGWELHVPSAHAIPVYRALSRAKGLKNAGWRALTSLSAEKGGDPKQGLEINQKRLTEILVMILALFFVTQLLRLKFLFKITC